MNTASWTTAALSLLGAVIGAIAALASQAIQARRQARADTAKEHKLTVEEVLVRSQAVDLQAHEMVLLATNLGSVSGAISRAFRTVAPVDFLEAFESMNREANGLQRAATRVWLFADEETVALTNAVVLAAMEVVDAHHQPTVGAIRNYTLIALMGRHARADERIDSTRRALAKARGELVKHTRTRLHLPEADPFSVAQSD